MDSKPVKKKRGRKPKNKLRDPPILNEMGEVVPKPKKKRGRKPKPKPKNPIPKIPKKRGRKPKPKVIDPTPKVRKKRGRKPKEKVYSVKALTKPVIIENANPTIILHLPIRTKDINEELLADNNLKYDPDISEPLPYEPYIMTNNYALLDKDNNKTKNKNVPSNCAPYSEPTDKNETKMDSKELNNSDNEIDEEDNNSDDSNDLFDNNINPTFETNTALYSEHNSNKIIKKKIVNIMFEFIDSNQKNTWPTATNICCMWCCHQFNNTPCALPEKYENGKFFVNGCFCSFNCAASYNFNKKDNQMWERYSLLNLMYKKLYNKNFVKISMAPPREILSMFGGYISIDEFRKNALKQDKYYKILNYPLVSIVPKIEENLIRLNNMKKKNTFIPIDKSLVAKAKKSLRLKRNKPVTNPNMTLQSYMDLKIV